jgi:hypothetical protein
VVWQRENESCASTVIMVRFDNVAFAEMLASCSGGVQGRCGGRQLSGLEGNALQRLGMDMDMDMDIVILFVACMLSS